MKNKILYRLINLILLRPHFKPAWIIISSTLLFLLFPFPLFSIEDFHQKEGSGFIYSDDIRSAKERAVKDALGRAVMDVVEDIVLPMAFDRYIEMFKERYTYNPQDFTKEFRILSEKKEGEVFKVTVDAVVARKLLEQDLSNIGILLGPISFPKVLIMVGERWKGEGAYSFWWSKDDEPDFGVTYLTFAANLAESGFDVIDPYNPPYINGMFDPNFLSYSLGAEEIKEWGIIYGADLIIFGETAVEILGDFRAPTEGIFKASTDVKVFDLFSEDEIFSDFVQKSFISKKNGKELEKALKEFSKVVVKGFTIKLIELTRKKEVSVRPIEVLLRGVDSYDSYKAFKSALKGMVNWIDSLKEKRFSRGEVLMEIDIKGDPFLFKEELLALDMKDVNLRLSSFSKERIGLTMQKR